MYPILLSSVVLLILPFIAGLLHCRDQDKHQCVEIYYRYFLICNMIIAGLIVAGRMLLIVPQANDTIGWVYNPTATLYAIAILSMVVLAVVALCDSGNLLLAPSVCWVTFLLLSSIAHLAELTHHAVSSRNVIVVHIVYDIIVSIILLRFMYLYHDLNKA